MENIILQVEIIISSRIKIHVLPVRSMKTPSFTDGIVISSCIKPSAGKMGDYLHSIAKKTPPTRSLIN